MTKIILDAREKNTLTISEVLNKKEGIVVAIYDNKISFLSDYTPRGEACKDLNNALHNFNSFEICCYSTASKDKREVLERVCDGVDRGIQQLYYFETAKEFAQAVLNNGWEF